MYSGVSQNRDFPPDNVLDKEGLLVEKLGYQYDYHHCFSMHYAIVNYYNHY